MGGKESSDVGRRPKSTHQRPLKKGEGDWRGNTRGKHLILDQWESSRKCLSPKSPQRSKADHYRQVEKKEDNWVAAEASGIRREWKKLVEKRGSKKVLFNEIVGSICWG